MLGLGVRNTAIRNLHRQGPLNNTTNPLDLAINGRGWFQVTMPNGEINYTRAGSFNKNADGRLVTAEGYSVDPAIIIPQNAIDVVINETGQVMVKVDGQQLPQTIGQLQLANFTNDAGLEPLGNGLYRETAASGLPVTGFAADPGFGKIQQGYLEDVQRRPGPGDHEPHLGPAGLRDELEGDPGRGRDGRHDLEGHPITS